MAAIHQANSRRLPTHLEIRRHDGQVTLAIRFPEELRGTIEGQLFAQYPDCRVVPLPRDIEKGKALRTWEASLHLQRSLFPIKRYSQFEDALNRVNADPLTALFMAVAGERGPAALDARIEITLRPVSRRVRRRALSCLRRLAGPFFRRHHRLAHLYLDWTLSSCRTFRLFGWLLGRLEREPDHARGSLTTSAARQHDREEDLQAAADKLGRLLFEAHIRLSVTNRSADEHIACAKLRDMAGAFGQFSSPRLASFRFARARRPHACLLSTEEVATLWHPATGTVRAPTMTQVESREMPPPVHLPTHAQDRDLAILGVAAFRERRQRFGIRPEDRRRHVAVVGKTGMGKSTLLRHLIASDIAAGRGAGLIDPHGDLCEAIVAAVPSYRTNDVILFDAGDTAFPLAFNVLSCTRPDQRHLVAEGVVSAFKKLYGTFWGPRMGYFLHSAVLALLEVPGTTLLSLQRFLSERQYRDAIMGKVRDPVVRNVWQQEFAAMPPKFQAEVVAPIQNKIGAFVSNPLLRNIIGQPRSTFDLRKVMDEGKVLLCNLSKGRTGDDASSLLGSFLVTAIQLAAMSRADIPEEQRRDFFLYVDEFQNLATESFATILSEARKYRVPLTLSHQYLAQVEEQTLAAVFGNVGTLIAFQVGAHDAEILAEQLGGDVTTRDLLTVPRYQAYVRLLIDGHPSRPFSLTTLPPPRLYDRDRPGIIRRTSRQRYARPEARVQTEIALSLRS